MAQTNKIDVKYVAELARLEISPEQVEKLQHDLDRIVEYIAELGELDVSGVEPTAHASKLANVWRDDVSVQSPEELRKALLANAPALADGELIKVPQVLPGEGIN